MGFFKKYFGKEKAAPLRERIMFADERLGECVLEKEEDLGVWMLVSPKKPLGRHEDVEICLEVPEEARCGALRCLAGVYEKPEAYLEKFYEGIPLFLREFLFNIPETRIKWALLAMYGKI